MKGVDRNVFFRLICHSGDLKVFKQPEFLLQWLNMPWNGLQDSQRR